MSARTTLSADADTRATATLLLRLGTLPFFATLVIPDYYFDRTVHIALVCHAGIILAFIGGLQQAAAIQAQNSAGLAVAAIVVAIVGCCSALAAALRGVTPIEPLVLALAYSLQGCGEALYVPASTREAMLHRERRAPMAIASVALVGAAYRVSDDGGLAASALVAVCTLLLIRMWRPRGVETRPAFGTVAVGTTNACKVAAVRRTLAAYPEVAARGAAAIRTFKVPSGVPEQPMGMEVTAQGAKNRAQACYEAAAAGGTKEQPVLVPVVGMGIQSGLFFLEATGKHYDVCVVSCCMLPLRSRAPDPPARTRGPPAYARALVDPRVCPVCRRRWDHPPPRHVVRL